MERDEIKYQLQLGGWFEDRFSHFHRLVKDKPTRVCFHKRSRITVEYRSKYKQWVIIGETWDRHVRRHGKHLLIDEVQIPIRK